jgi:hypothetical protein
MHTCSHSCVTVYSLECVEVALFLPGTQLEIIFSQSDGVQLVNGPIKTITLTKIFGAHNQKPPASSTHTRKEGEY